MRVGLSVQQLWRIIVARRRLIFLIILGFFLATVLVSLFMSKVYEADASVLIALQGDDPITGRSSQQFVADSYFATQIDILKSRKVRLQVVKKLNLTNDAEAQKAFADSASAGASFAQWLADGLLKNLDVQTHHESRIVDVLYESDDRQEAAAIANAIVRAYRDISLGLTEDPARKRQSQYADYLASLRADVDSAQDKLTKSRQSLNLIDTRNQEGPDTDRLKDLNIRLNQVQSERDAAEAKVQRIRELQRSGQPLTAQADVLDSKYIQELKGRLVELETMRAKLGKTLGENHPRMQSLDSEIATVRQRLGQEVDAYIQADRGSAKTAADRERALRKTLSGERSDIMDVQRKRDEIASYKRELESAQQVYKAALANYDQVLGSSKLQQTNVSVIHWATPPESPIRPKWLINILVGLFLGLLTGLAAALLLELSRRRVRSDEDVAQELRLDVLGVIPG